MNIRRLKKKLGITKIAKLIKWLPIIWEDEDFDFEYLEKILIFKLKLMRDFFNSEYAVTLSAKEKALEMDEVIKLLSTTEEDCEKEIDPVFYEEIMEKAKEWIAHLIETGEIKSVDDSEEEEEHFKKRIAFYEDARKKYIDYRNEAYDIIKNNVLTWWD